MWKTRVELLSCGKNKRLPLPGLSWCGNLCPFALRSSPDLKNSSPKIISNETSLNRVAEFSTVLTVKTPVKTRHTHTIPTPVTGRLALHVPTPVSSPLSRSHGTMFQTPPYLGPCDSESMHMLHTTSLMCSSKPCVECNQHAQATDKFTSFDLNESSLGFFFFLHMKQ